MYYDPRDITEILSVKHGDMGALTGMINQKIKEGWTVFPDSYQYDHGTFTIMLAKIKSEKHSGVLDTSTNPVSSLLGDDV